MKIIMCGLLNSKSIYSILVHIALFSPARLAQFCVVTPTIRGNKVLAKHLCFETVLQESYLQGTQQ